MKDITSMSLVFPSLFWTLPRQPRFWRFKRVGTAIAGAVALLGLWAGPSLADDPFRTTDPHAIGDGVEAAFRAMFEQGDYRKAAQLLETAETDEPMTFAMRASLDYMSGDMDSMGENATLTRQTAEQLVERDPLRGYLYTAVGHFLEGAYVVSTQGTVRGTPTALGKLQQVFENLSKAEEIDANDPELNLLKGYMDLMLAVNLPFTNPNEAIARLENYASPGYLAQRGIALAYRDLDEEEPAIEAVDRALQETPANPDLLYLKAQILVRQGRDRDSLTYFQQSLERVSQLPRSLAGQIAWEACRTQNRISQPDQNCSAARDQAADNSWQS